MKQNQIKELPRLDIEHLENIFNVYQDQNGMYFYNLLQTVVFPTDLPDNLFESYAIRFGDTWPYISYKKYKTPNLWWVILLANNIQDPTKPLVHGNVIRIPIKTVVTEILTQIQK